MFPIKEEKNKQLIDDSDLGDIIEESITEESKLDKKYSKSSLYKDAWRRLVRNKLAMIGLAIVIIMALIAILAPYIAPYDPIHREKTASQEGPSAAHWFGTDILGRDIFSRVLYGTQISMLVGVVAVSISLVIGLFLGALSGFFSGVPDAIIMRILTYFLHFPIYWVR